MRKAGHKLKIPPSDKNLLIPGLDLRPRSFLVDSLASSPTFFVFSRTEKLKLASDRLRI